jgi:hypothetical protein
MRHSTSLLLRCSTLAVWLPFTLVSAACSDDGDVVELNEGGAAAAGSSGSASNNGGSSSGGTGGNGGTAGSGGAGGAEVTPDTTAPTVVSNHPLDEATGESTGAAITVTFSEAMEPLTGASFSLKQGAVAVPGVVSYLDRQAVFMPTSALLVSTSYTATVTTDAEDLAGNALAETYTWSFETDATTALGPAPVLLGASGKYAILAKSAISNVPTSAVTGDLGLSPAAASYVTGFPMTRAGASWTSPQVVGNIFAADNDPPTPSNLTTAIDNMQAAYTDAAGRPTPDFLNLGAGTIGGLTLAPGLYQWTSSVTIPTDVTISGTANDVWIFQITDDLVMSAAKNMILIGGARAKNIFWQVAGSVDLGTTAHFEGIILSKTAITLGTGASINGRLLAQTAVNIAGTTVVEPAP